MADEQRGGDGRAVTNIPIVGTLHRQVATPAGLIPRVGRALQVDPSLYREVAAPGASIWQAFLVVVVAAVASGIAWGARLFHFVERFEPALHRFDAPMAEFGVQTALSAIVHLMAWPVWAAAIWAVGQRLAPPGRAPGFRSVARTLGFVQAPGLLLFAIPIMTGAFWLGRVDPNGVGDAPLGLLASSVWSMVSVWVLVGTFVAVREVLGLGNGRALGALVAAGATTAVAAVLLGLALASISGHSVGDAAFLLGAPSGFDVASGIDFNLGLGLTEAVMAYLIRLAPNG